MATETITKTCRICKETKDLSGFYKTSSNQDGYKNECKICQLKHARKYHQTDKGKTVNRKANKRYGQTEEGKAVKHKINKRYRQTEKGKAVNRKGQRKYQKTAKGKATRKRHRQTDKYKVAIRNAQLNYSICHLERRKAKNAVNNAIASGKLPRTDTLQCHYCSAQAKLYHHHKGYEPKHWLDVVPVCQKCHTFKHCKAS